MCTYHPFEITNIWEVIIITLFLCFSSTVCCSVRYIYLKSWKVSYNVYVGECQMLYNCWREMKILYYIIFIHNDVKHEGIQDYTLYSLSSISKVRVQNTLRCCKYKIKWKLQIWSMRLLHNSIIHHCFLCHYLWNFKKYYSLIFQFQEYIYSVIFHFNKY